MVWNKAEGVGGLSLAKDDNTILPPNLCHFIRQLL